ncbi:hypothetical protein Tco_0183574, partial [Tanacetum coccineum]
GVTPSLSIPKGTEDIGGSVVPEVVTDERSFSPDWDSPFELEAFSDSDYGGVSLDRKSTTCGCQFLGRRLISWQCKKQTIVENSTTGAEYVAAANCYGQEKTNGNAEFHEIIDFLTRSSIHYALTLKNVPVPLDHFPINALTSTDKPKVSIDKSEVRTAKPKEVEVSTDKLDEGNTEPKDGTSDESTAPTTVFRDDETIAEFLVSMSQTKAKQKGVEIKDAKDSDRPRATSTRSVLTLKPLPKIDPKDKGKKVLEEEAESDAGARIEVDRLLAARLQEEERETFTVEERAKFLYDKYDFDCFILSQVSHTDMWSLDYLSISVPSRGRYKTTPPSPNVVKSFIKIPRQGQVTRIKNKKTIVFDKNEILTRESQPHMKPWADIIRENAICLGGHKEHVFACLCHMLYFIETSTRYKLAFFILKRMEKTQNKPKELLPYGMLLTRLFKHVVSIFPELAIDYYLSHDRFMQPLAPYYE